MLRLPQSAVSADVWQQRFLPALCLHTRLSLLGLKSVVALRVRGKSNSPLKIVVSQVKETKAEHFENLTWAFPAALFPRRPSQMAHLLPPVPTPFLAALPQEACTAPGWGMGCPHPLQPREGQCQATELCPPGDTAVVQAQLDFSSFNQKQAFKLGKEKSTEQKKIYK